MAHLRRRYSPLNDEDTLVAQLSPQAVYLLERRDMLSPLPSPVPPPVGMCSLLGTKKETSSLSLNTSMKREALSGLSDSLMTKAEKLFLDKLLGYNESIEDELSDASWITSEDEDRESREEPSVSPEHKIKSTNSLTSALPSRFDATSISTKTADSLPNKKHAQVDQEVLAKLQMAECPLDPAHAASAIMRGIQEPGPSHPPRNIFMPRLLLARLTPVGRKAKRAVVAQDEDHMARGANSTHHTEDQSWRRWTPPQDTYSLVDIKAPARNRREGKDVVLEEVTVNKPNEQCLGRARFSKAQSTPFENDCPKQESREQREMIPDCKRANSIKVFGTSFNNTSAKGHVPRNGRDTPVRVSQVGKVGEQDSKKSSKDLPERIIDFTVATRIVQSGETSNGLQAKKSESPGREPLPSKCATGNETSSGPNNPKIRPLSHPSSDDSSPPTSTTSPSIIETKSSQAARSLGFRELKGSYQPKAACSTQDDYLIEFFSEQNSQEGIEAILNETWVKSNTHFVTLNETDSNPVTYDLSAHQSFPDYRTDDIFKTSSALSKIPGDSHKGWSYCVACCADSIVHKLPERVETVLETSSAANDSRASCFGDKQEVAPSPISFILESLEGQTGSDTAETNSQGLPTLVGAFRYVCRHLVGKRRHRTTRINLKIKASRLIYGNKGSKDKTENASDHTGVVEHLPKKQTLASINTGKTTISKQPCATTLEKTLGHARNPWTAGSLDALGEDWSNSTKGKTEKVLLKSSQESNQKRSPLKRSFSLPTDEKTGHVPPPTMDIGPLVVAKKVTSESTDQTAIDIVLVNGLVSSPHFGDNHGQGEDFMIEWATKEMKNVPSTTIEATNKTESPSDDADNNEISKQIRPNKKGTKFVVRNHLWGFHGVRKEHKYFHCKDSVDEVSTISRLSNDTDSALNNLETEPNLEDGINDEIAIADQLGNSHVAVLPPCLGDPSMLTACLPTAIAPQSLSTPEKGIEVQNLDQLGEQSVNPIHLVRSDDLRPEIELIPLGMPKVRDLGMSGSAPASTKNAHRAVAATKSCSKDSVSRHCQDSAPETTNSSSVKSNTKNKESRSMIQESSGACVGTKNKSRSEYKNKLHLPQLSKNAVTRILRPIPRSTEYGVKEFENTTNVPLQNMSIDNNSILAKDNAKPIATSKACAADLFFIREASASTPNAKHLDAVPTERMVILYPLLDFNPCNPELLHAMNGDSDTLKTFCPALKRTEQDVTDEKRDDSDLKCLDEEQRSKSNKRTTGLQRKEIEYLTPDSLNQAEASPGRLANFATCGTDILFATETALSGEEGSLIVDKKKKKSEQKVPGTTSKLNLSKPERPQRNQDSLEDNGNTGETTNGKLKATTGGGLQDTKKGTNDDKDRKAGALIRKIVRKIKTFPPREVVAGDGQVKCSLKETRRRARDSKILSVVRKNKRRWMKYAENASQARSVEKTLDLLLNVDWESQAEQNRRENTKTETPTGLFDCFLCGCNE